MPKSHPRAHQAAKAESGSAQVEWLRGGEEHFRLLVESIKDYAIFMLDPSGMVVTWNAGAAALKGYEASRLIGRHFSVFYPLEDRASGKPARELRDAVAMGRYEDEGWRIRADGTRFWANVVITPLRGPEGELRGFAKVTRDFTERKNVQEELLRVNDLLTQRTHDLEAAYDAMATFSYSVSHDLRAPIRAIDSYAQLLANSNGLTPVQTQLLSRLRSSTANMSRLVEDLLALSRVTSAPIVHTRVDLTAIAREIVGELQQLEPAREVEVDYPSEPLVVEGDPNLLRVVMTNLLANAWKFSRHKPKARIVLGEREREGRREFFVEDNGAGFEMAHADRLFEPFERLHASSEFEGSGIGLAIVERTVRRLGGTVGASGAIDEGATFWFTLPQQVTTS